MSNLSEQSKLAPSAVQLPVDVYFDESLHARELSLLFDHGPRYVGHDLWVPEKGSWRSLPWENHGRVLVRNSGEADVDIQDGFYKPWVGQPGNGVQLMSNVCRHRQAIMLKGHGQSEQVVCPLHRWTYGMDGTLIGAPHFEKTPCARLETFPTQNWRGLHFASKRDVLEDLAQVPALREFDFSRYRLDTVHEHVCNYNWKTFIEVYLEDYHVGPFHPGLGQFVTCNDLKWHFGEQWSLQTVGVNNALAKPGSPVYERWHAAVKKLRGGQAPHLGSIWFCFYPNVMVEWYPDVLVVSTLHPEGPKRTRNIVEFYYPEEVVLFEREFVQAQQAAYMETAVEDDEIAERMDEGRAALMSRGTSEVGPYQSPMEDGMRHFHEWYRAMMNLPAPVQESVLEQPLLETTVR